MTTKRKHSDKGVVESEKQARITEPDVTNEYVGFSLQTSTTASVPVEDGNIGEQDFFNKVHNILITGRRVCTVLD